MDTKKLRQKILDLAIHGKLVPQDPNDEPASVLLERIRTEKEQLIKEGKIKAPKKSKTAGDTSHYEKDGPFEVPKGWAWSDIGFLCSKIGSGATPRGSNYSISGIPFFRSQNIYNDGIDLTDIKYISPETHQSMISTEVLPNDLLLNITGGSLGRCAIVPKVFYKGNVSQHVCILRTIKVLPRYLHCVVLSSFFSKHMETSGSGREGLPKYSIEKMLIPVPPIQEQQRIVDEVAVWMKIVSHLETSVFEIQNNISAMRAKILDLAIHGKLVPQDPSDEPAIDFLRRINPSFTPSHNLHYGVVPPGWALCPIGTATDYGQCVSVQTEKLQDSDWILELEDIEKGTGRLLQRVQKKDRAINGIRHRFIKGQVLYPKLRTYLNKVLIADDDGFCTTEIVPITPYQAITSQYLNIVLRSPYFLDYTARCGYGVKMPRLGTNDARKALLPIPPIPEQQRIVTAVENFFEKLDSIVEILK